LQDGWERCGQVGQEVYGAGIAFGIVPRQYFKVEKGGFMVFNEYPATDFKVKGNMLSFYTRGDARLDFRMVIVPMSGKKMPGIRVWYDKKANSNEIQPEGMPAKTMLAFRVKGDSRIKIEFISKN
ncbi:MAG: hypothetical protein ACT6R1_16005, partial [Flavobacterium sp.]